MVAAIVMVAFNRPDYLRRAMASLLLRWSHEPANRLGAPAILYKVWVSHVSDRSTLLLGCMALTTGTVCLPGISLFGCGPLPGGTRAAAMLVILSVATLIA